MGNPDDVTLKNETKNEVKTEINPPQCPQTSDAPLDLMLKRPVSKTGTIIEVEKEINSTEQPQTSNAPLDLTLKRPVSPAYSDITNEEPQSHSMFLTPNENSLVPPVSSSLASLNSLVQRAGTPQLQNGNDHNPEVYRSQPNIIAGSNQALDNSQFINSANDVSLNDSELDPESANFQGLIMDVSDQHSDISDSNGIAFNDESDFDDLGAPHDGGSGQFQLPDNKVQSPKENSGMDNKTSKTLGTGGEVVGKPADIAHKSEAKNEVKTEINQAQQPQTSDAPLDLKLETPLSNFRTKKTRRRGSRGPQLPGGPGQVEGPNTGPGGPSVSLEGGPLGTNRPLQNGPSNAANSLPFIMDSNNSANPGEPGQPHGNTTKEKVEKFIPLEFMITSQNSSGFPMIVGQILGHLDFDTLVSCRLVSTDFNNFLDDKTFWIACLDQVRKEYLDKLLVEGNLPKPKCSLVNIMSPKDIKKDYGTWITLIEIIKSKDCIEDLINFTKLIKQSEELITSFASFCPIKFMFAFWAYIYTTDHMKSETSLVLSSQMPNGISNFRSLCEDVK